MIVAEIIAIEVVIELQVLPSTLLVPFDQPRYGRAGDDGKRNALLDVSGVASQPPSRIVHMGMGA